jgi:hypothetical protein
MTVPEWPDRCMEMFVEGETDDDGNPRVHGLRRVAEIVIGPIVDSHVQVAQTFSPEKELIASATFRIGFASRKLKRDVYFADAADVTPDNLTDPKFSIYATAVAATRAEGRALRKALKLKKCAAEEINRGGPRERPQHAPSDGTELIRPEQISGIQKYCRDMKLDVLKVINSGGSNYSDLSQMSRGNAAKLLKVMGDWWRGTEETPAGLEMETK